MVSAAEVAEQVAKAEPSQNERDQAMRMLHRWSETDASIKADDETVKLYVVLRHAHPGMELEKLPSTRNALIDPNSLPDLPQQYKDGNFYVVDQVVSRSELGVGVLQFEVSAGYMRSVALDGVESGPDAQENLPQLQTTTADSLATPAKETKTPEIHEAAESQQRVLTKQDSDANEADTAELIAKNASAAFAQGRLYSSDVNDPGTAEFWLRAQLG
ncbi:unnamed protein product [Symbiodinium natans]|uniref:Uncharacterized protein n=1 Tax=Symbiodinium natans TaxID=878477 RepID=A0A812T8Y1_9DINO|nr:unnamed protein product [Symbiodinium natans]